MTIRESIRSQWETMKGRPFKEQLSYFWGYYGKATIFILIAVISIISLIVTVTTQKESAFCGVIFGANTGENAKAYLSDFAEAAGIDRGTYEYNIQLYPDIRLDSVVTEESYYSLQGFSAMVSSNSVETIAADKDFFIHYCYLGYMTDLRTALSAQELETLSPYLYYVDGQLLKAMEDAEFGEDVTGGSYPDPKKPDAMSDPIPMGIDLNAATAAFRENYMFISKTPAIGICTSTKQPAHAAAFIRYIMDLPMN